MKTSALTIRLDQELERRLAIAARRTGRSRSELVRDAVRRQLALDELSAMRRRIMPLAPHGRRCLPRRIVRIALDTNVIVAAFGNPGLCADVLRTTLAEQEMLLGKTVLDGLDRVLRTKLGMPQGAAREVIQFLRRQGTVVQGGDAPQVTCGQRIWPSWPKPSLVKPTCS